ncbi:hypothetical protein FDP41_004252 [Naegleria fowleri]|uniref:Endonuclease V n=1 Tax=Naegleria fowleri TaxID=5763 RepID=A0A6A5BJ04_NAEFO|nr:uncharacterized protein FDP41_004252 [Naegleria fowleri]KAF0976957.1 hypothetical protein FDP41_004252 [Naegleria fowleri]CAG4716017.1 unnamed protein product [Naegleria fowleri]
MSTSWADLLRGQPTFVALPSSVSSIKSKFTFVSQQQQSATTTTQQKFTSHTLKASQITASSVGNHHHVSPNKQSSHGNDMPMNHHQKNHQNIANNNNGNIYQNINNGNINHVINNISTLSSSSVMPLSALKQQWKIDQLNLKKQLKLYDQVTFDPSHISSTLKYIGGVDISFDKIDPNRAVASLVVLSFPDLKVIYENYHHVTMSVPYLAGFLAFREVPHFVKLLDELKRSNPHIFPQVILVDGNGILHQRGFGSACHLGVLANVPTIGVAKKMLYVDGITEEQVQELEENELERKGDYVYLTGKFGKDLGAILLTSDEYHEPVYVSIGHCVSLKTAIEIVTMCCLDKIPEPIKQADLRSRKVVKMNDARKNTNRSYNNNQDQGRNGNNSLHYGRQQPSKKSKY